MLKRAAEAETALNELALLLRGSVSVHASQTIANYWLPAILHGFQQRYPKVTIGLIIGNAEQVAQAVVTATHSWASSRTRSLIRRWSEEQSARTNWSWWLEPGTLWRGEEPFSRRYSRKWTGSCANAGLAPVPSSMQHSSISG